MENPSSSILPRAFADSLLALEATGPEKAAGRINGGFPIAVVDIGSNSVRLVVYERLSRAPTQLFNEKALCGLGRGVSETRRLSDSAVASALASIRRFRALVDQIGVPRVDVLATAAVREASNGGEFIATVEHIMRAKVSVLSGPEEARLAALGVVSGIVRPDGVAGDLGGGSLELIEVSGNSCGAGETFPLGGLALEGASGGDPSKAEKIALKTLEKSKVLQAGRKRTFYAIGGTWRSLAKLHMQQTGYPLRVMHEYAIDTAAAVEFCRMVSRHDVESLDSIEAVSKSRRALLRYGAAVLGEILAAMKPAKVVMSALGLREGHLYDLLDDPERTKDPLFVAADELAILRARSPSHARELATWTDGVFKELRIDETMEEARLRKAACLLSDTGWRAHAEYRGLQSLNMIAHAAFIGIDHPGRAFLAMAVYYRHEGVGIEATSPRLRELLSPRLIERARVIGAVIRVAHMISAAMPGIVSRARIETRGGDLVLVLPLDLEPLAGDRVMRRMNQLAKIQGKQARIEIAA